MSRSGRSGILLVCRMIYHHDDNLARPPSRGTESHPQCLHLSQVEHTAKSCYSWVEGSIREKCHREKCWDDVGVCLLLAPEYYHEVLKIIENLHLRYTKTIARLRREYPQIDQPQIANTHSWPSTDLWQGTSADHSILISTMIELALLRNLQDEMMDEQFRTTIELCLTEEGRRWLKEFCKRESQHSA